MSSKSQLGVNNVLNALGNQTRRDILAMLKEGEMSVGAIATQLPISRPAVSKHLRILQEANLVGYNTSGVHNIFYLNLAGFCEARGYLDQFWNEALVNFQRVAEETNPPEAT